MFCCICGQQLPEGTKFCLRCGTKLIQEDDPGQARTAPNGITPAVRKKKPAVKLLIFIPLILILIGVPVLLFCLPESESGGRKTYSSDTYDGEDREDGHVWNQNESVSLTQTYLNEDEGFSFLYPDDWEIEDTEEALSDAIVSVACSGMFGINARIAVAKDIDDGFLFTASRVDFEEMYFSAEDISNVEIMDLSDIVLAGHPARKLTWAADNDIGTRVVEIQYFYIRDSYVYAVMCVVEDKNYDRYEPIFDAIMDTYSITVPHDTFMTAHSASEQNARQILIDWFQRHPLTHSLKVKFTNTVEDTGDGTSCLLYEMYIEQEKCGILKVNPESGEIIMDRGLDDAENPAAVQTTMDQWYLKYYWGWTDDSGYYSQYFNDDQYTIYDGDDVPILEYHIKDDSYFICNFDLQCLIEYDDGTEASGIDISDFAGTYGYDASFDTADITDNFYYLLEIGEWDGCCLSITESWRGNELIHDEWATPESLVVDTLTLRAYDPNEACYKTHTLKYIPAAHSSYGQDVIYLDGDESMPYIRE